MNSLIKAISESVATLGKVNRSDETDVLLPMYYFLVMKISCETITVSDSLGEDESVLFRDTIESIKGYELDESIDVEALKVLIRDLVYIYLVVSLGTTDVLLRGYFMTVDGNSFKPYAISGREDLQHCELSGEFEAIKYKVDALECGAMYFKELAEVARLLLTLDMDIPTTMCLHTLVYSFLILQEGMDCVEGVEYEAISLIRHYTSI